MSSADKHEYDEQLLTRYLLGAVSGEEAERLDKLSISDDEFAWRLNAIENDLVDGYARGELSGDTLERFKKFYLSSPKRLEKVEFAKTLLRLNEIPAVAVAQAAPKQATSSVKSQDNSSQGRTPWRWFGAPRLGLQWVFAGAAFVMLFAAGYLFVENERLRTQETAARNQQAALDQRTQALERELSEQRSANSGMLKELEHLREAVAGPRVLEIVAALLLPQTRGIGQLPTITLPQGTDQVRLRLQLESNDFPTYRVALKDPTTNLIVWHSAKLKAKSAGENEIVSMNLPASLLKQQNYTLELAGIPASGASESVSSYSFRVARN